MSITLVDIHDFGKVRPNEPSFYQPILVSVEKWFLN